jgi:hypothetical protein
MKEVSPHYEPRRQHIRSAFCAVIDYLESTERSPGDVPIGQILTRFNADAVHEAWDKALTRRGDDPDGAITAARTLIETVCKHILDEANITYRADEDLHKLWIHAADQLNLAPKQQHDPTYKAIMGNCVSVVNYLAAIRNSDGDAHGRGKLSAKPDSKHAELAVNLAGAVSAFIVATWEEQRQRSATPF